MPEALEANKVASNAASPEAPDAEAEAEEVNSDMGLEDEDVYEHYLRDEEEEEDGGIAPIERRRGSTAAADQSTCASLPCCT